MRNLKRATHLPGHTSGDDDNVGVLQGSCHSVVSREVSLDHGGGVDVRHVCCDTWCVDAR